ncbi:MAG: 6-carboxytetrahydropterin synthase [Marinagarivorans sp.]|nr:6-carboxytetrahydropterin synthase [Marinagarivorans sp.]
MRLFVDNLTNVDFSYLCPARGMVGETWLAHIELVGGLDEQGMVCDFGVVKKKLRHWLDTEIDHRLLVPTLHTGCQVTAGGRVAVDFPLHNQTNIKTAGPAQAITLVPVAAITPSSVARWCETQLKDTFGSAVSSVQLRFTNEAIDTPFYHYSHGLKKHGGNCQRIAHGHRSKLLIWKNGTPDDALIEEWTDQFHDIYLGTRDDICAQDEHYIHFSYTAQQGDFTLSMPKAACYLMDTDTTVELIAEHIASKLKAQYPSDSFTVKAFEGIGKGAIASA